MKWHDLVFSDEPRLQYRRHTLFWLAWFIYFTGTFFYKQQPFIKDELFLWIISIAVKSIFILLGHAFFCYATIYLLLPRFLLNGKYFSFAGMLFLIGIVITGWTLLCYNWLFPLFDSIFHSSTIATTNVLFWNSTLAGILSSLKLVTVAITIKLLKRWWLKQNENMRLEKEKLSVELQLLKAQIHPDFLFSSLDKIYYYAQNDSAKASSLLLKLSDLLSYMLYECNQSLVSLEKEIKMIRNYLELGKKRLGDQLDVDMQVIGEMNDKMIAPLLLLPLVENSFLYCENKNLEKGWINLDIRISEQDFSLKLINGKSPDTVMNGSFSENGLANVQKRLDILCKDRYELKITGEPDYIITFLKIQLYESTADLPSPFLLPKEKTNDQTNLTIYASI